MLKKILPHSAVSFTVSDEDTDFKTELTMILDKYGHALNSIYVRVPDRIISGSIVVLLKNNGFKYYDFDTNDNMFVYYIWTGRGSDKVPEACTSIGGACMAVKSPDGKSVLLIKERFDTNTIWKLPGGAVDLRETFVDGAIRESEEETGVKINKLAGFRLLGGYTKGDARPGGRNDQFLCFGAKASTKILGENDGEALECRWFGLAKLRSEIKKNKNNVINADHHARAKVELSFSGRKELFNWRDLNWACTYQDDGLHVQKLPNGVWTYKI